ncbi:MAG TPA: hypothetical protein VG406_11700 [Isosphaeraceae bacterium]|nr:hypothetical protein [Isosphaeraceae bacterium]
MAKRGPAATTRTLAVGAAVVLACATLYLLAGSWTPAHHPNGAGGGADAEVAVFFERDDWDDFRGAALAVARAGRAREVAEAEGAIVLEAPRSRRRVRFTWHRARGQVEAREEAKRLAGQPHPPLAVVGSSNTALTVALAEGLRDSGAATAPALLVPLASAVRVEAPDARPVDLLAIHRGRTFRFCVDNHRLAERLVRCLADREPDGVPKRARLVVDRHDPYSRDLAHWLRVALEVLDPRPTVETEEYRGDSVGPEGEGPNHEEARLARSLWRAVGTGGGQDETACVFLPLQKEPMLRLLEALRTEGLAPYIISAGATPLRVVGGDGISLELLRREASGPKLPFPVWVASPASGAMPGVTAPGAEDRLQVPAEVVAAVVHALDGAEAPADLAPRLSRLDLAADDPAAMGRPLAFGPAGERRDPPGRVLEVQPGLDDASIFSLTPGPRGGWAEEAIGR